MLDSENTVPKRVFIVPYRNRKQQKFFFSKYMTYLLEDDNSYEIYFSHQADKRGFNRGASKNIGFLAIKRKYPNDYTNISFIFNDVDTMPFNKIFDYDTQVGIIKHYYGFTFTLGGIVVIKGIDFEKINGFPNYWGYGMEDNCLQKRAMSNNLRIDRRQFYPIGSPEILQLFDGISRIISKKDPWRLQNDTGVEGLSSIYKLMYSIDTKSSNDADNEHIVNNLNIYIINISYFITGVSHDSEDYYKYDLREPHRKIIHPSKIIKSGNANVTTDDWNVIPHYPTQREKIGLNIKQQPQHEILNNTLITQRPTHTFKIGLGGLK
jgi:hypothetical protein